MTPTDRIESEIEDTRQDLRSNVAELEERVKSVVDWRRQYEKRPGAVIAAAVGLGALLAVVTGGKIGRSVAGAAVGSAAKTKHGPLERLDTIKSALVGLAATRFSGFLGELMPGFRDELSKAEAQGGSAPRSTNGTHDVAA